jgi:hypothetical protein
MKFDSPLFDKIRVKPGKDRRPRAPGPRCEWPGCAETATHRAPKGRGQENQYWRYCLGHVREYNQNYNFFSGMADDAVIAYQRDALTGHRPTWKMGTGKRAKPRPDFGEAADPFNMFHEVGGRDGRPDPQHKPENRMIRNAERKALDTMGLEVGVTAVEIKARFKDLVKRHHPDANGGDRSTEDRLVEIIQAYNYLKSVGMG